MKPQKVFYSDPYETNDYIYRHVIIPKSTVQSLPEKLLNESEWRALGLEMSVGWEHYMIHKPERHVLLFRKKK
ncbi:Cyclin-dependent protein kinase CDC28, regulatory subunit CKS1 [Trachipleistophora hominis]|uniref:Cyclin-dependent kinases regulatory subunit n=1 Tax=Trachipleistophora hominis TaxID=72359 RepID=L7K0H6_TRAHO|nr:Cyclin-dependent protein kinase CDC28, regulatory subunit CKS1 [Trachipleistophora hominis]